MEKELLKAMTSEEESAMLQAENEANGTTFVPDDDDEEETATFLPESEVAEPDLNVMLEICQSAMHGNIHDLLKLNKYLLTVEERANFQRKVLEEAQRRHDFVREVWRDFTDIL